MVENPSGGRAPDPPGSAFDTDALAFGVPDRLLQCVEEEVIPVSSFQRFPQPRSRQVEVGPNFLEHTPQIYVELCHSGPAPVPVPVVDLEDLEPRGSRMNVWGIIGSCGSSVGS